MPIGRRAGANDSATRRDFPRFRQPVAPKSVNLA
jgi:hypothetical protein